MKVSVNSHNLPNQSSDRHRFLQQAVWKLKAISENYSNTLHYSIFIPNKDTYPGKPHLSLQYTLFYVTERFNASSIALGLDFGFPNYIFNKPIKTNRFQTSF